MSDGRGSSMLRDRNYLLGQYWCFHPRFRFIKTLPFNSRVLDVGAGSGGLVFWKNWSNPNREDLELHAIDHSKGDHFDKYDSFRLVNLDREEIDYPDAYFDAVFMSHILEHIHNVDRLMTQIARKIKVKGRIYIEIPTPLTLHCPNKSSYAEKGIVVTITNFLEDATHYQTYALDDLINIIKAHCFSVTESGIIHNSYLEDILLKYGMDNNDVEINTYAIWSKLRWAQYIYAIRDR